MLQLHNQPLSARHCIWHYMLSWIVNAFWLVLTYVLLEEIRKDEITVRNILIFLSHIKKWILCCCALVHFSVLTAFWHHPWSKTDYNIASKFVESNSIVRACFVFLLCTLMTSANISLEKKIFHRVENVIKQLVHTSAVHSSRYEALGKFGDHSRS